VSTGTAHSHIKGHNKEIEHNGFCKICARAKSELAEVVLP